jgi:hypothetical protein
MDVYIAEMDAGRLAPVPVALGPMPEDATRDMRALADEMAREMGLQVAVCDPRPLIFSTSFACERMGWTHLMRASRTLNALVAAGVVAYAGELPRRGKPNGTKTYTPPEGQPPLSAYVRPFGEPPVGVKPLPVVTG